MSGVSPDLIERFRRDLEALTGEAPAPERPLGLAVSGGPDSMALLLLAAAAFPGAVIAATVDHGLRPEAAGEAAQVAAICAGFGIDHATLTPPPGWEFAGNVQEGARMLRYAALRLWAEGRAPWIAVAHQRDDVAETFLMRARRGSGVGGLAAMRRARPLDGAGPMLVRPLLDWNRAELGAVVRCAGMASIDDRSNRDPRFDRSRIRALIAESNELVPSRLARSAQNLRHAEEMIDWAVRRELPERFLEGGDGITLVVADSPYELRRRLARLAIDTLRRDNGLAGPWHDQGLDRLLATLASGGTGTIAGVQARVVRGKWHFRLAPPRRSH